MAFLIFGNVQSIQRQKQTINLAISADSFHQLKECLSRQDDASKRLDAVQTAVSKILDIETKITLNQARREVLEFFTKEANPRPDFEMNKKLRHPLTGVWFTEGFDFQEWYSNPGSKIWISGIPGAGKSVLAGAIIVKCIQLSSANDKVASAYFFCSYKDTKTHLADNILSSLASQIARQNETAFEILQAYYEELRSHNHLPGDPSSDRLLEIIAKMSSLFDQVFIVVDGLDECDTHTDHVVHSLIDLSVSQNDKVITTALLSRDELSIRLQLESTFMNIDIEAQTEDIQLYVASELENRTSSKRLRLRNLSLKDQIMTQLVDGAKGMFRWVACQLDHLCELPTDRARREALTKLPPTLPASYERILHRVESSTNDVQKIVQRSLQLILTSTRRRAFSIQQICEAVSVSIGQDTFEDDEIVAADEIMRWCSSLIRRSADCQRFEFAHYSVMEFLEGICSTHPNLSSYHVSIDKGYSLLAPICLRYLTFKNHEQAHTETKSEIQRTRERNMARPFYEHAAMWWPYFFWHGHENGNVATQQLLYCLFDLKKTQSFTSWALELVRHCLLGDKGRAYTERDDFGRDEQIAPTVISAILRPDFTPLHMASALGLFDVCQHLLGQGAKIGISSRFGTPLHCALGGISVFFDGGLFPFRKKRGSGFVLPSARYRTTQILLAAGANTTLHIVTPFWQATLLSLAIQSSAYDEDFEMVVSLIRAGVEIEDNDLGLIDNGYKDAIKNYTTKQFKAEFAEGKAILSLLEALGTPENDDFSSRSRLYALTFQFAKVMELDLDSSLSKVLPGDSATDDTLRKFVLSVVESNDAATMEKFLDDDRLEFSKAIKFSGDNYDDGSSVLHICIRSNSIDVLKLLLEAGCDPDVTADNGTTPAQLCYGDGDQNMLRVLLEHGASTITQDADLETIWHICAYKNSTKVLKLLVELDQIKDTALRMQSKNGCTPICEALGRGNKDTVRLLQPHCTSIEYWKGDLPFFRKAAELGSADIVQALLDLKIPLDSLDSDVGSPLHFLGIDATIECTKLLVTLFPHCHIRCKEGRTPFESLLVRSIHNDDEAHPETFKELLKEFEGPEWQQQGNLWPSVCSAIIPYAISTKRGIHWLKQLLFHLFETGVIKSYEEEHLVSALVPLTDKLEPIGNRVAAQINEFLQGTSNTTQQTLILNNWSWLSQVLLEVATKSSHCESVSAQASITRLLSWAIIHDDTEIIELLLKRGVDIHNRVDELSALELACLPEIAISKDNFARLLSYAQPDKLKTNNERVYGLNLLHLTATNPFEDRGSWKLKQILDAGGDCNACASSHNEPALVFHINHGSVKTSSVLIEYGADPWLAASDGIDAALIATFRRNSSILKLIAQVSIDRNLDPMWERACTANVKGEIVRGASAIHLAAGNDAVKCLEFYVNEGLVRDLEPLDDDMRTPMHYAARFNSLETIEFLQSHGCNVNVVARGGITPLHLAVQRKHHRTVKMLLKMGSEMKTCSLAMTPLAYAYQGGDDTIVRLLKSHQGQEDLSAAHALRKEIPILIDAFCAAVNRNDIRACEYLHSQGCLVDSEATLLFKAGSKVTVPWRVTPLMMALCNKKKPELVEWLIDKGATTTAVFQEPPATPYLTILEAAAATPIYNGLLPILLTRYFEQGGNLLRLPRNPLHLAVQNRNLEGLKVLVSELRRKYGISDIIQSYHGHSTAKSDHRFLDLVNQANLGNLNRTALHEAVYLNGMEGAEYLIANAANADLPDVKGFTPLHIAAANNSEKIVELLIKHSVRSEPTDNWGRTPLMLACHYGCLDTIKLLVVHKEPRIHTNLYGENLLYTLSDNQDLLPSVAATWEFLCDRGIDAYQVNCFGLGAIHLVLANPKQNLLRHVMRQDPTLQWIAKVEWSLSQLWTLWDRSWCAIDTITDSYRLIHQYAGSKRPLRVSNSVTTGEGSLFHLATSTGFVKALDNLLIIGADLEQEFGHHGTALTVSAAKGHLNAVKYLFRKRPRTISKQNETIASAIAVAHDYEEIVQWLLVVRHTDQRKIAYYKSDSQQGDVQLRNWSGIRSFPVALRWDWKRRRDESMMEYAQRRREIVLSLQGTVAE